MKVQDKINYNEKINLLRKFKHELKRRRIVFDEERTNFKFDRLEQLSRITNTSEIKGYPCAGFSHKIQELFGIQVGIKINPLETKYKKTEHPSNLEYMILKRLTEDLIDTDICPHIVYFLDNKKVSNRSRALKFISNSLKQLERDDIIKNYCNVLFSEFVEGGCLNKWIKNCYGEDSESSSLSMESITLEEWKYITFSLLYTLYILQTRYKIIHNDVHYGNILIDNTIKAEGHIVYEITIDGTDYKFYFKNFGFIPKIWDFEFAMCYDSKYTELYPNKFIMDDKKVIDKTDILKISEDSKYYESYKTKRDNSSFSSSDILCTPVNYNEHYDVHYFLTSLLDLYISDELFSWITNLFPKELIPETTSSSYTESYSSSTSCIDLDTITYTFTDSEITEIDTDTETTETYTESSSSTGEFSESDFLYKGRMINGVEKLFRLPKTKDLLLNPFFSEFLNKPEDFDENKCLFFKFKN